MPRYLLPGRVVKYDGADRLPIEGGAQLTGLESVHELNFLDVSCIAHQFQNSALHHQVIQIPGQQFSDTNTRNMSRGRILLWIRSIKSVFILDIYHLARAKYLGNQ